MQASERKVSYFLASLFMHFPVNIQIFENLFLTQSRLWLLFACIQNLIKNRERKIIEMRCTTMYNSAVKSLIHLYDQTPSTLSKNSIIKDQLPSEVILSQYGHICVHFTSWCIHLARWTYQ